MMVPLLSLAPRRRPGGAAGRGPRRPRPRLRPHRHLERARRRGVARPLPRLLERVRRGGPRRDHVHPPPGRRPASTSSAGRSRPTRRSGRTSSSTRPASPIRSACAVAKSGSPATGWRRWGRDARATAPACWRPPRPDERPLWVSVWGGANTLAQALWDARATPFRRGARAARPPAARLRDLRPGRRRGVAAPGVPEARLRRLPEHPGLEGVLAGHLDRDLRRPSLPERPRPPLRAGGQPLAGGERHPRPRPLGALYPRLEYIMEGDTPSFLGLVRNGLGWAVSPAWGGWGGRYVWYRAHGETRPDLDEQPRQPRHGADGRRPRAHLGPGHDLALARALPARLRRAHGLVRGPDVRRGEPQPGAGPERRRLAVGPPPRGPPGRDGAPLGEGDRDPDGHGVELSWFVYREAGTFPGEVALLREERGEDELHRAGGEARRPPSTWSSRRRTRARRPCGPIAGRW
jgi:hypothetical protein